MKVDEKTCVECGEVIRRQPQRARTEWSVRKYCGRSCQISARNRAQKRPVVDRFWANVTKTTDCWLFGNGKGYKNLRDDNGGWIAAHHMSLRLVGTVVPADLMVLHSCDTPACVNPDHLRTGTAAENMQEAAGRDRMMYGAEHPNAKLDDDTVRELRRLRKAGMSLQALADRFGVSKKTVLNVVHGRIWKRVA